MLEPLCQVAYRDISYPGSRGSDESNSVDSYKYRGKQWKTKPLPKNLRQSRNQKKGENKTTNTGSIANQKSQEALKIIRKDNKVL